MNITVEEIKLKGIKVERGSLEERFNLELLQEQIVKDVQHPIIQKNISKGVYNCLSFKNVEDINWVTFKRMWYYFTDDTFYLTRELAYSEEIKNTMAFIKTNPSLEEIRSIWIKCLNDLNENPFVNKYDFQLLEMIKVKHKIEVDFCNIRAVDNKTAADMIVKIPLEITN